MDTEHRESVQDSVFAALIPAFESKLPRFSDFRQCGTPQILDTSSPHHSSQMTTEPNQSHGISRATSNLLHAMGMKYGMNDAALNSLLDRIIDECDDLDQMADRLGISLKSRH